MWLKEVHGDLFTAQDNMAHCVSADFRMSAGIAVKFRDKFNHQAELRAEGWGVGQVARKQTGGLYVFYMVTKRVYHRKPTYRSLRCALVELARWVELLGLRSLAIPPISCVRDKLHWPTVRGMIIEVFGGINIGITVYH